MPKKIQKNHWGMVGIRPIYIHKNSDLHLAPRSARRSGFSGGPNSKSATVRDDESNHLAPSTAEFFAMGTSMGNPKKILCTYGKSMGSPYISLRIDWDWWFKKTTTPQVGDPLDSINDSTKPLLLVVVGGCWWLVGPWWACVLLGESPFLA